MGRLHFYTVHPKTRLSTPSVQYCTLFQAVELSFCLPASWMPLGHAAAGHSSDQRTPMGQTPPLRLGHAGRAPSAWLHQVFAGWTGVARRTTRALTVVQCDQTPFSATSKMLLSDETKRPSQRHSPAPSHEGGTTWKPF